MDNTINIIIHIIVILLIIIIIAYAIYYIHKYNNTLINYNTCISTLNKASNLLFSYEKLPVPVSSILSNNLIIQVPVLLTYDAKGTQILAPIESNNTTNIGLVNRNYNNTDYTWYLTISNNNIVIMDSTKTRYINAHAIVNDQLLTLSTSSTNNTFVLNNNLISSLNPISDASYTVVASNSTNNLLKLSNTTTSISTLYIINFNNFA